MGLAKWDLAHMMAPGVPNATIPRLSQHLRYWWNEVNFSSTRITFDWLHYGPVLASTSPQTTQYLMSTERYSMTCAYGKWQVYYGLIIFVFLLVLSSCIARGYTYISSEKRLYIYIKYHYYTVWWNHRTSQLFLDIPTKLIPLSYIPVNLQPMYYISHCDHYLIILLPHSSILFIPN